MHFLDGRKQELLKSNIARKMDHRAKIQVANHRLYAKLTEISKSESGISSLAGAQMLNKTIKTVVPKLLKQEVSNKFGKLKSDLINKTLPIDNSKQTKKYKTLTIKSQNSQKELKNQN